MNQKKKKKKKGKRKKEGGRRDEKTQLNKRNTTKHFPKTKTKQNKTKTKAKQKQTELEGLATLQDPLVSALTIGAGQVQHDLLGGLSLLVENGLGLSSIASLKEKKEAVERVK